MTFASAGTAATSDKMQTAGRASRLPSKKTNENDYLKGQLMAVTKPLAGLKIADFSMVYAGPICARMLSDIYCVTYVCTMYIAVNLSKIMSLYSRFSYHNEHEPKSCEQTSKIMV